MKKYLNSYLLFFITYLFVGLIFAFLMPTYQVPDEQSHISMIYEELNQNINSHEIYKDFDDTIRITYNKDQKVNKSEYFRFEKKLNNNLKLKIPSIRIIRHLPQAIGIIIGHFFKLPMFIALFLAELLALLFYTLICTLSLKIIPFKKHIMAFIMLLPVSIQQAGSLSYDAVLIPICFL